MKHVVVILLLLFFGVSSCKEQDISTEQNSCITSGLNHDLDYSDLVSSIPENMITALVERPAENGALGRNKNGYFHVRFQFDMTRLTDYAIRFQDKVAVSEYLKNLTYSFSYQNPDGDFQFTALEELANDPNYQQPSEADLASGTAFFGYSIGMSLLSLNQSQWYKTSNSLDEIRKSIKALDPEIERMLDYLRKSVALLNAVDANAPNRLLFNAIAFYSLGMYLEDQEAMNIGISFAEEALKQRNNTEGYFIEGGGWDSSYNGVAIKLGFELFTLIPNSSEQIIKDELEKAVSCATDWQKSRILTTGEISSEGNSRVFPGGEEFLGNAKEVDVVKTVKAFFYMNILSDENEYELLAQKIVEYYE